MKKMFLMLMGGCLLFASAGCVDQVNLGKLGGAASSLHAAATLDDAELKAMCVQMRQKGAFTIGQDKESCVVYGMPMVAYNIGAVCTQASCDNIPSVLLNHLKG